MVWNNIVQEVMPRIPRAWKGRKGVFMIIEATGNMLKSFFESFLAYFME